jgi:hypothetical protein
MIHAVIGKPSLLGCGNRVTAAPASRRARALGEAER